MRKQQTARPQRRVPAINALEDGMSALSDEALAAKETFITSASLFVQPVVSIDGKMVANGKPGPMATRLREIYIDFARATAV